MKRLFTAAIIILLMTCFSTSAFAHSHIQGSNPADGDVVTEQLSEVVIEFDGGIEEGSFIELTTAEGEAVDVQDIVIGEGTLTGTLAEPLANDDYQVNWSIISADGHPLEGEFTFTVDAEVSEPAEEETEEPAETETAEDEGTEEPAETETAEEEEAEESAETETAEEEQATESAEQVNDEEDSSSMTVIIIVVLAIIVIVGLFLLLKRKK